MLRRYEQALQELELNPQVWPEACDLARQTRSAALTCPLPNIVTAANAPHRGAQVEVADRHFERLRRI